MGTLQQIAQRSAFAVVHDDIPSRGSMFQGTTGDNIGMLQGEQYPQFLQEG